MRKATPKSTQLDASVASSSSGLYLSGTIRQRSKRIVPVNNPTTEIVTYLIIDNNDRHYYVEDFAPKEYFDVNQEVNIPIYIKPYKKKTGEPTYSLNVLKPFRPSTVGSGELF